MAVRPARFFITNSASHSNTVRGLRWVLVRSSLRLAIANLYQLVAVPIKVWKGLCRATIICWRIPESAAEFVASNQLFSSRRSSDIGSENCSSRRCSFICIDLRPSWHQR